MSTNQRLAFILSLFILFASCPTQAEQVTLPITQNLNSIAYFQQGDNDKPAILFVHGFLQTGNFSTVKRLSDELSDSGFTVLRPNLTLGFDFRKTSLACEAIHTNAITDDSKELSLWVDWLKQKTHQPIILIGHSAGANTIVDYLSTTSQSVEQVILISLAYFHDRPTAYERKQHAEKAYKMLAQNNNSLSSFALAFCKDYVTTPDNFLSYYQYSRKKVINTLKSSTIPIEIIIGGNDKRVSPAWSKQLISSGLKTQVIDNASHFFDKEHEFDLFDRVEEILE